MSDSFQLTALVLTALLLPAFAHFYMRWRDKRILLWLIAFILSSVRMLQVYRVGLWDVASAADHPWLAALGQSSAILSGTIFLGSVSPLAFIYKGRRIPYAVPFAIPLVLYAILLNGVYHGEMPISIAFFLFPALGALALFVGCFWAFSRGSMPSALGLLLCVAFGGLGFWICFSVRGSWPLVFVEGVLHLLTALVVFYLFRRFTPGTVLTGIGFLVWSMNVIMIVPSFAGSPAALAAIQNAAVMSKIVAAFGLLILAFEEELARRQGAQDRESRSRRELQAYTKIVLSRRRVEDFDRQGNAICQTIAANSRFAQAVLIMIQPSGQYRLVGASGLDEPALTALEALTARIAPAGFLALDTSPLAAESSRAVTLSLEPWLLPGDDLERLHMTQVVALPLAGPSDPEGAIFLAGLRDTADPLRAEDLFPIEVLAERLQASRNQTMSLEKMVDAEKVAGLGQLANNVTRQLNNPLTVILGYASLLEVTPALNAQERKGIEAILTEARNMRSTLENLSRMSRSQSDQFTAISVTELLNDMEQLHRSEFLHRAIDFRLQIAPALPRALGNAQQVRQAVLYCLQFAIEAVENIDGPGDKYVRVEATAEGGSVRVLIGHSGPGFLHPARAFDPFVPAQAVGETAGMGLSLCATILRENNGRISAMNFEPRGAGIILELQAA
ncbi:MAG TPA: histidine kinase dimerization/phospho-acceptor domain-containing protein [Terracidiphilus sp.]|nr:histidine kinase dimerization/phospho-acceptor domain-containing protein [Terracidiphilus sp.]